MLAAPVLSANILDLRLYCIAYSGFMVLVTGGTGFIGSYIMYELLKQNPEIKALRRDGSDFKQTRFIFKYLSASDPMPNGESWEQAFNRIKWVEGDVTELDSVLEALEEVDIVYHAAALVSYSRKRHDDLIETNVIGTATIVNACLEKGIKKLAYVSSVATLDRKPGEKLDESAFPEDLKFSNTYAESKYRAEMEVWRGIAEGLDAVIINPGIVLGWGNFDNSSPEMFKTVYEGLKYYPTGSNAFVDVRDVAKALVMLAGMDTAVNNRFIAKGSVHTYKEIFDLMAKGLGVTPPKIKVKSSLVKLVWIMAEIEALLSGKEPFITKDLALTSSKNYDFDSSKLEQLLHFHFTPIEQTIAETCKVFKIGKLVN